MDKQVFKLVRNNELNNPFKINVTLGEQSFSLTVLQQLKAWTATVDRKKISTQAKQLEIGLDEYFGKIREYLIETPENVELSFGNNEFTIHCNLENSMRVKYFTCKVNEVDYGEYVENLIEKYYTENSNALRNLKTVQEERHTFEREKHDIEVKLNEFIEKKKTDDQELYNNFVLVLNEKKTRIQHLNGLLEAFRRGRPTVNQPVQVKKRTEKSETISQAKIEPKKEISDTESEDSYDTDEEKQTKQKHPSDGSSNAGVGKSGNMPDPVPSTSKCEYDLFSDDSPPRHLLPKRVKTESSVDVNNISKPSTTTAKPENDSKEKENIGCQMSQYSPNVDISTQELLDNI